MVTSMHILLMVIGGRIVLVLLLMGIIYIPARPMSILILMITVGAVTVTLRVDIRRARSQAVTVRSRTSSSRPPDAIGDAFVDVTIRANVVARTEKVEKTQHTKITPLGVILIISARGASARPSRLGVARE